MSKSAESNFGAETPRRSLRLQPNRPQQLLTTIQPIRLKEVDDALEKLFGVKLRYENGLYYNPETKRTFKAPTNMKVFIKQQETRRIKSKLKSITKEEVIIELQKFFSKDLEVVGLKIRNPTSGRLFKIPKDVGSLEKFIKEQEKRTLNPVTITKARALNGRYTSYTYTPSSLEDISKTSDGVLILDLEAYLNFVNHVIKPLIVLELEKRLTRYKTIKYIITHGFKLNNDDKRTHWTGQKGLVISKVTNLSLKIIEEHVVEIQQMSYFNPQYAVLKVDIAQFTLNGSSFKKLPKELQNKNCIINVKNTDNKCFMWSILAAIKAGSGKVKDAQRTSKYKDLQDSYIWPEFPVDLEDLDEWEKANDMGVSVYGWDVDTASCITDWMRTEGAEIFSIGRENHMESWYRAIKAIKNSECEVNQDTILSVKGIGPIIGGILKERAPWYDAVGSPTILRVSNYIKPHNLLLHDDHYTWIKNINKFVSSDLNRRYSCGKCFKGFRSSENKDEHEVVCSGNDQVEEMPEKDFEEMKIDGGRIRTPIVIYADLEALNSKTSYKNADSIHVPCSYGFYTKTDEGFDYQSNRLECKREKTEDFIRALVREEEAIKEAFKADKPLVMTEKDIEKHNTTEVCYLCSKPAYDFISNMSDVEAEAQYKENKDRKDGKGVSLYNAAIKVMYRKIRDYSRLTGVYAGVAHSKCSMRARRKQPPTVPVLFHNASGYDIHHIIRAINNVPEAQGMKMGGIADNTEKMKTFQLGIYHFMDSYAFLASSLSVLMKNLPSDKKPCLKSFFGVNSELLTQKQIFPYEWLKSVSQFDGPIPKNKSDYYSSLTRSHPSNDDMKHLDVVIDTMGMKDFGDYHDAYLAVDVLGLADVFEAFREISFNQYGVEPLSCISLPSYAWKCMLKVTGVKLQLIKDKSMYEFFERGIRGGVSMIVKRHAVANNEGMSTYDKDVETSFLRYWDANNLYGIAMMEKLPLEDFRWLEEGEQPAYSDGWTAEVDLEYPKELHDLHSDLPLAPENIEIKKEQISEYSTKFLEKHNKKFTKSRKLVGHFNNRYNYVIHKKNLQYYLDLGMVVTKTHRVLTYTESRWLKPWIEMNTNLRTKASNNFEKDFYKLMNNSTFGKTMENVRGRTSVHFCTTEKHFKRRWSDPTIKGCTMIGENLVITHHENRNVKLNKPIYAGQAILDLSKLVMYNFHYGYVKPNFPQARLCMTDTDSLCYHIATKDINSQLDLSEFDCSNLNESNPIFSKTNKKVPGKMKDECDGVEMTEFVGHRSKVYAYTKEGGSEERKCKGVPKIAVKKDLNLESYKDILEKGNTKSLKYTKFKSKDHAIFTITETKIALSAYDDKRYMLECGLDSRPYGHYLNGK